MVSLMINDEQFQILWARLHRTEGRRRLPYYDTVGKLTIGVGFNLTDVGLYDDEIDFILKRRIERAAEAAATLPAFNRMDPTRQAVLVDMVFNMGLDTVKQFVNTLHHMEVGNYEKAAQGMRQSKWYKQVGRRAEELARIMETGSNESKTA